MYAWRAFFKRNIELLSSLVSCEDGLLCSLSVCIPPTLGAPTSDQQEINLGNNCGREEGYEEKIIAPRLRLLSVMQRENEQMFSLDTFDSEHAL